MISLDQVLLLQEKVETAVAKISQLNAENDALRKKCAELTNALSAKSEQVAAFESDQNKIEETILKALDRLNSVEHYILKAAGQQPAGVKPAGLMQAAEAASPAAEPDSPAPAASADPAGSVEPAAPAEEPYTQGEDLFAAAPAEEPGTPEKITVPPVEPANPVIPADAIPEDAVPEGAVPEDLPDDAPVDSNGQFDIF